MDVDNILLELVEADEVLPPSEMVMLETLSPSSDIKRTCPAANRQVEAPCHWSEKTTCNDAMSNLPLLWGRILFVIK